MTKTEIESIARNLVTYEQIKKLQESDLAAVYMLVCNRKTAKGKTPDEMASKVACDISAWRRRDFRS
jgi:hypothetical protein